MKKIISIMLLSVLVLPAFAAEKETPEQKAAHDYSGWLPAAGDWSIGFSIDPIATFIGNTFNGNTSNSLGDLAGEPLLLNNMASIMGSYMLTNNLGLRANIGLNLSRLHNSVYVTDDKATMLDPLSRQKVEDARNYSNTGGSIALGAEYRTGKRRVQGVFGGGVLYAFATQSYTYTYGNAITEANQVPTTGYMDYEAVSSYMPQARPLKNSNIDGTHSVGLYGNVGVEWFIAPKIALGANVNVILAYSWTPKGYVEYEGWNLLTNQVENFTELKYPVSSRFKFGTENIGANLYAAFYF